MKVVWISSAALVLLLGGYFLVKEIAARVQANSREGKETRYAPVEAKLIPLARELGEPEPGDWLYEHDESGQTFSEYVEDDPVRKSRRRHTIYLCLVGDFTVRQKEIIEVTRAYMAVFFNTPVKIRKQISVEELPEEAKRINRGTGAQQLLTTHIFDEVLAPDMPADALAYLAFTAQDLWPGSGWNFVFGEARSSSRTGVWSIYRNGDPDRGRAAFRQCLARTMATATHETGHILGMSHCIVYECSMNGSNSLEEGDRKPLHLCPVCLRKLCWNLEVEPVHYLKKLAAFCGKHGLKDEARWYQRAIKALKTPDG
jgi:archaemetzincin